MVCAWIKNVTGENIAKILEAIRDYVLGIPLLSGFAQVNDQQRARDFRELLETLPYISQEPARNDHNGNGNGNGRGQREALEDILLQQPIVVARNERNAGNAVHDFLYNFGGNGNGRSAPQPPQPQPAVWELPGAYVPTRQTRQRIDVLNPTIDPWIVDDRKDKEGIERVKEKEINVGRVEESKHPYRLCQTAKSYAIREAAHYRTWEEKVDALTKWVHTNYSSSSTNNMFTPRNADEAFKKKGTPPDNQFHGLFCVEHAYLLTAIIRALPENIEANFLEGAGYHAAVIVHLKGGALLFADSYFNECRKVPSVPNGFKELDYVQVYGYHRDIHARFPKR